MDVDALIAYATVNRIGNSIAVGSGALLVYDYALTLPMEINFIWLVPWRPQKVLWLKVFYLLTRYLAFVDIPINLYSYLGFGISLPACQVLFSWYCWSFVIGITVADGILAMRTWVIWNQTRTWLIVLATGYLGMVVSACILMAESLSKGGFFPTPDPAIAGCVGGAWAEGFLILFSLVMTYEFFIFVLTAVKGVEYYRNDDELLLGFLYRDGLIFTACAFFISVGNVVVINYGSEGITLATLWRVLHSVLSSRILLHIREAAYRPPDREVFELEYVDRGEQPGDHKAGPSRPIEDSWLTGLTSAYNSERSEGSRGYNTFTQA